MLSDNDPNIDGKYLGTITKDFVKVAEKLKEASYLIRKKGFSEHPVFVVCKVEQPIGELLVDKSEAQSEWHFYASYLNELEQRGLVTESDKFLQTYKDPDEFCCLLIIDQQFINFVYLPFPEEE